MIQILSPSSAAPSSAVAPCCRLPFCRSRQLRAPQPQQQWSDIIAFEGWRAGSQGRCLGRKDRSQRGARCRTAAEISCHMQLR